MARIIDGNEMNMVGNRANEHMFRTKDGESLCYRKKFCSCMLLKLLIGFAVGFIVWVGFLRLK